LVKYKLSGKIQKKSLSLILKMFFEKGKKDAGVDFSKKLL
jgi:hypothetical protein